MGRPRSIKGRAREVARRLTDEYPEARCELDHRNPFELLVATILSAQCTDARVNQVTPLLFERFRDAAAIAGAEQSELEDLIHSTGFFRNKATNLIAMSRDLAERFGAEVPADIESLTSLPGVGRKTANVVLSVAFDLPGLPVDTHVGRLARRLGLTEQEDPVRVESELCALLPPADWGGFSLRLILHGRRVCAARSPRCDACVLADICPASTLAR